MKTTVRVPVIVRRQHRPEWGPIKHCIYVIYYTKNRLTPNGALYVGRFKDIPSRPNFQLGFPYVGRGFVLEALGLKLQNPCTFEDLPYHAQFIDHIECWYCEEKDYKSSESTAIYYFAETYGISPRVLEFFEPNSFTKQFVCSNGLLLNCTDNCMQPCKTPSTLEAHHEGSIKGGLIGGCKTAQIYRDTGYYSSLEFKEVCSKGGLIGGHKVAQIHKDTGYYDSPEFKEACSKGALRVAQVRKSFDRYSFSESGLGSLSQAMSQKLVNGKIPPISVVFCFQSIVYVVSKGVISCARKASEITGIYVAASSLSKSLKRNHGDTVYKGIHFKYASLLTEDELKSAVTLK